MAAALAPGSHHGLDKRAHAGVGAAQAGVQLRALARAT